MLLIALLWGVLDILWLGAEHGGDRGKDVVFWRRGFPTRRQFRERLKSCGRHADESDMSNDNNTETMTEAEGIAWFQKNIAVDPVTRGITNKSSTDFHFENEEGQKVVIKAGATWIPPQEQNSDGPKD